MDELDRMFRRLVENIRNGFPELLTQPFEVSELFQTIIPYRHNRRELAIDTNEEYELTLCRLLSGERSMMGGDDVMRETIREQLGGSNPNTAIYREFASSKIAIVADAVRRLDSGGAPSATPPSRSAAPMSRPAAPTIAPAPPPRAPNVPPPPIGARSSGPLRADPLPSPPPRPSGKVPQASAPANANAGSLCRFCGGTLPSGRRVMFCPNCGQNLAIARCPACGSELDLNWKFCVTCGRSTGGT